MKRWLLIVLGVLTVSAASAELLLRFKTRALRRRQETEVLQSLETGALQPMLRARALGQRMAAARAGGSRAGVLLALVDTMLARLFGLDTDVEAEQELRQTTRCARPDVDALCGAVEALLSLGRGQIEVAREQAQRAAQLGPREAFPLIALAMAHARAGALTEASQVLEAVMVREPQMIMARVAWAEVRIDLGDAESAALELQSVLARAPGHTRAALLLSEARTALDTGGRTMPPSTPANRARAELRADCDREGRNAPAIGAACALEEAGTARLEGRLDPASAKARAAAAIVPPDPRLLARAAQLLAQLGEVDSAAALVERASAAGGAASHALAWARAAVTLGRGGVAAIPDGTPMVGPEARVISARAAFAAGGRAGLAAFLAEIGPAAIAADPDLARLAGLLDGDAPPGRSGAAPQDVAPSAADAYVAGMRARLRKDDRSAVEWLSRALAGHGDACRAAGEYLAALRSLGQPRPPGTAFAALGASNRACINTLSGAQADPPPREHIRAPIR